MAQEAKSPPAGMATGGAGDNPFDIKGTSASDIGEDASFALDPAAGAEGQKKLSLAERLRAEQQRKTSEPKVEEQKPADAGDAASAAAARAAARARRPAGPAPRRIAAAAANDDLPSIGGLIFALQQKPSKSPFLVALVASLVWFVVGGIFAYSLIANQLAAPGGTSGLFTNPAALTALVTVLVPIAIFWFLALLVWRAQELRLMASAMTEVAVRLAEPDKLAEQSVASLGQTIRRQVAAMNDAISRAIGRAGELEALVHNEVATLERSYSDNELRVRGLISELASEREALSNNSHRVSESLRGVGQEIARNLAAASSSIDKKLAERGSQLTELLVARSNEAAEQVERAQGKVQEHMPILLERLGQEQERLGQVIEGAARNLSALEVAVGQRTTSLDQTLKERTDALSTTLASRINALESTVSQGALILDKTLKDRTEAFAVSVGQGAIGLDNVLKERTKLLTASINQESAGLDKSMKERTEAFATLVGQGAIGLDKTLKDRTDAFAALVGQSAIGIDTVMKERTRLLAASITEESAALDKTLKERTEAFVTTVGHGALGLDKLLKDRTQAFAATIGQEATALDKSLKDRTEQLTTFIGQGSAVLDKTLKERTEALASTIGFGAAAIDKSLKDRIALLATSIGEGTQALDRTLQGHGEAFNAALTHQAAMLGQSLKDRTEAFSSAINQGAISLDRTLADRSEAFTSSLAQRSKAVELAIGQHTAAMDKQLADRTQMVTESLTERLQLIDSTFGQRAGEIDRVLAEHARTVEATFGRQAAHLNELLANNSVMIRQTAEQVGAQSTEAISVLTAQTQTLRDVSSGLLEQIHNLTQRFENQGQAILTAAKALDFVEHQNRLDPGEPAPGHHRPLARSQHQGRGPRQHDAVLCRHGGEHADHRREPRQADRLGARPRHRRPGAAGALPDRALARRGASSHRARGRRPQVELRDRHHPDRTPARADARAIRQRFARHARRGTEDRDRSRLDAAGDAAPYGRPTAADGAGHRRHPQGARRSAERDRGDHSGADAAADPAEPSAGGLPPANTAAAGAAAGLRLRGAPIRSARSARTAGGWRC